MELSRGGGSGRGGGEVGRQTSQNIFQTSVAGSRDIGGRLVALAEKKGRQASRTFVSHPRKNVQPFFFFPFFSLPFFVPWSVSVASLAGVDLVARVVVVVACVHPLELPSGTLRILAALGVSSPTSVPPPRSRGTPPGTRPPSRRTCSAGRPCADCKGRASCPPFVLYQSVIGLRSKSSTSASPALMMASSSSSVTESKSKNSPLSLSLLVPL